MPTIAETLAQAQACQGAGDLPSAEQLYRRVLAADAVNAEAHHQLGVVLDQQGKLDEAAACYRKTSALQPNYIPAHGNLGNVLRLQGKLDEAAACYRRVLALNKNSPLAHNDLGLVSEMQGRFDEAATYYRRALELHASFVEAHSNLGNLLSKQGKLAEAVASYRRAAELRPDSAEVHSNLGAALANEGNFTAAEACCRRALELKPDYSPAYFILAFSHNQQGKLAEAATCCRRAIELNPDNADAHHTMSVLLAKQEKFDEAVTCCRRVLELRPNFADAHNNLAILLRNVRKPDESAACCRRAIELKPDFAEAYSNLAIALAQQGKLDEAVACCRRALELKPDFAEVHSNLGVMLKDQNKLDEAAACCRRAIELRPDFADAYSNLASVLIDQSKLDEAVPCFLRVLELKPDLASAHYALATVFAKGGNLDEAAARCRRAIELQPDLATAYHTLAAVLAKQGNIAEAKARYLQAIELNPRQDSWRLNIVSLCPSVFGSIEDIDDYRRTLLSELEDLSKRDLTFELATLVTSDCRPSFNLQFHGRDDRPIREAFARVFRDCFPAASPAGSSGRPRIGFVVTDRHEQIFLKSMGGILEHMDPDLFELIVIGSESGLALLRSAIRNPAVKLLSVPIKFDRFVEAIRDARLDLLYYWEVATDSINYFLPFFRLAPVQCTSWGIQVTSGIPQLDYYLSSELIEPEEGPSHYTENLVLASTLLTYQERLTLADSPKPRESFGVAADQHMYLCAQQLGKFQPDFDPILAGILRQDAQGVVVVTEDRNGRLIAQQLRQRFAATIPDVAGRIVFIPFQPISDYLSLIAAADVLLDPLHFGGVNSSYDGFSLNKPIVTLPSRFQRGRYTLACYKKMGVSACVASDPQQYIDIAVALGTDAAFRSEVVEKIRRASPVLFEDMEAVREHERIFSMLVEEARSARRADAS